MDCLRFILKLWMEYKKRASLADGGDAERDSLSDLVRRNVVDRLRSLDMVKLLHSVSGNAAYFGSLCMLMAAAMMTQSDGASDWQSVRTAVCWVFESAYFERFAHLLQLKGYRLRYREHVGSLNVF